MIYFFDGSSDGFLTAFIQAFHDENAILHRERDGVQLPLGQTPRMVETSHVIAQKARTRLCSFDRACMRDLDLLLRCGEDDSAQAAYLYFRFLAQNGRSVRHMLAVDCVYGAMERIKRVGLEIHRLHGFVRFMETASGALYAPISPDHDICDLLLPHFRARFPAFAFVLHDVARKKAAVYDGKNAFVARLDQADVVLAANEQQWQALFKRYYAAVNIPSRERLKQMRGYMPKRYQKFMPETQE